MLLEDVALVRTGVVAARKKSEEGKKGKAEYKLLNLKCISVNEKINLTFLETFSSIEPLNNEFFTHKGDVLVRLSAPYTAILIKNKEECGLLVPSHFAIIRAKENEACPEYILWFLKQENTYQKIIQNSSGSSAFGTISSGFLGSLEFPKIPLKNQKIISKLLMLSEREQELLNMLANEKRKYNQKIMNTIYESFKKEY